MLLSSTIHTFSYELRIYNSKPNKEKKIKRDLDKIFSRGVISKIDHP
jgi:hypothetical protein